MLKMGHHGLKTSSTPEFLKALAPDYAVQTGYYSLIPLDRIEALDAIGTRLYCAESVQTRGCKAFTVSFSGKHVEVDAPANVVMLEDRADGPRRTAYLNGRKVSLNGWLFDNVGWSWFESSPYAIAGSWLNLNGTWYLFDEAGRMATGWKKEGWSLVPVRFFWSYAEGVAAAERNLVLPNSFRGDGYGMALSEWLLVLVGSR